jgi:cytochrome c
MVFFRELPLDTYEWNRIAGAVLAALITVLGLSIVTGYIFTPAKVEKKGYEVAGVEEEAPAQGGEAAATEQPIEMFLASADPARGEAAFKKCAACHSVDKGGAAGIGPNLYAIVGAPHARAAGFDYSDAMDAEAGKPWDWKSLDMWIMSPKKAMPGNKMAFAGISKPQERADILAYLNSKSDNPLPIPAAPAASAPAEAAAAGEAPAAEAAPAEAPEAAPAEAA